MISVQGCCEGERERERDADALVETSELLVFFIFHKKTNQTCSVAWADHVIISGFGMERSPTSTLFCLLSDCLAESEWMLTSLSSPARAFFNLLCHIHFLAVWLEDSASALASGGPPRFLLALCGKMSHIHLSLFFLRRFCDAFSEAGKSSERQTRISEMLCRI